MNEFKGKPCPDCNVSVGQFHQLGCDVEQCPYCGRQLLSCCCRAVEHFDSVPDDDRILWMGYWPGDCECEQLRWFCKPGPANRGWVPCSRDDPQAIPDLNRLLMEATWAREKKQYEAKHP